MMSSGLVAPRAAARNLEAVGAMQVPASVALPWPITCLPGLPPMHLRTLLGLAALPRLAARWVLALALGLHVSLRNALYCSRSAWQLTAIDLQ